MIVYTTKRPTKYCYDFLVRNAVDKKKEGIVLSKPYIGKSHLTPAYIKAYII
jgi:hypothetical protein